MKHLLYGVAIAAALAIAAPASAQTPTAPATAPAAAAPAPAPMASKQRHKRVMHHRRMAHRGRMVPGDAMTEQLNREELARIQGGGPPPGAPMPMEGPNAGAGQGGPRASGH